MPVHQYEARSAAVRRTIDAVWRWVATGLAGMLISGTAAYFSQRDMYLRNAITREEVEQLIAVHDRGLVAELSAMHEEARVSNRVIEEQLDLLREGQKHIRRSPEVVYRIYTPRKQP